MYLAFSALEGVFSCGKGLGVEQEGNGAGAQHG
jgi:hypothetical protein